VTSAPTVATGPGDGERPRFDPTAATGGGVNASAGLSAEELTTVFSGVQQASGLRFTANSSPAGARGNDVVSVSIRAEDASGALKDLDAPAKKLLGETLLDAAAAAWPNARVTLLVAFGAGGGTNQILGSRPPGGPNSVLSS
jgi:hypothetical protein